MRNEAGDLVGGKLNRVFVVHAPVNPFFVIDVCEQMQDGPLNVLGRRVVIDSVGVGSAMLLIRHMKNERMFRPQSLVFEYDVSRDCSPSIASVYALFYFMRKIINW